MRVVLLSIALSGMLAAADLKSKLDDLVSSTPAVANAFVGMRVVSLIDGKVLYERNADRLFVPASNMKLFTTALALSRLGAQYRFTTQIGADQPIDARGTLAGNLIFTGGGDPSLSGREYPYRNHSTAGGEYSFHPVNELVKQLVARGLKRVEGDIVGDDRRYVWSPYADGWASSDEVWEYGAPVSALIVDDNSFAVTIHPGETAGDPARISLLPTFEYFSIDNRVRTVEGSDRRLDVDRKTGGRQLHLWGAIGISADPLTQLLAVDDPAVYAAEVLRDELLRHGIAVRGKAVARHRFPDDGADAAKLRVVLAERSSPPLAQLLQVVDKVSQNLHAEVMLREVGAAAKHFGSREAGLNEMRDFLNEVGVDKDEYRFSDGSGLSRSTLVTPTAFTKLLAYMYQSNQRETWVNLLPVAGVDGTLGRRFADHPEARAIRAKTGTLGHVRANSGYVDSPEYGPLAFSFLVNNHSAPVAEINKFLDAVELAMLH
jgi:serine-type D-Ala-D-Ala carboxypeptidase/endopeptidase (penicillin-binding protein 4)